MRKATGSVQPSTSFLPQYLYATGGIPAKRHQNKRMERTTTIQEETPVDSHIQWTKLSIRGIILRKTRASHIERTKNKPETLSGRQRVTHGTHFKRNEFEYSLEINHG